MANARQAILDGVYAAGKAHSELDSQSRWERDHGRINVFATIDRLELPLMFRPLVGLLGAYLVQPTRGILINIQRPLSVQRYTAAHELGHFLLGHTPSLDYEDMMARVPFSDRRGYDEREIAADAFAVTFLLPQWLVGRQMQRHGWTPADMHDAKTIYQLALRAGLSYQATCYALRRYNVIDTATCTQVVEVPLKTVKQSIIPNYEPPQSWHLDVWMLGPSDDGLFLEATTEDVLEISLPEHSGGGYLWDVNGIKQSEFELLVDHRSALGSPTAVGGHVTRHLIARAKGPGFGSIRFVERRPWESNADSLSSYQFSYDISALRQPGLLAAQRDRMIGSRK